MYHTDIQYTNCMFVDLFLFNYDFNFARHLADDKAGLRTFCSSENSILRYIYDGNVCLIRFFTETILGLTKRFTISILKKPYF